MSEFGRVDLTLYCCTLTECTQRSRQCAGRAARMGSGRHGPCPARGERDLQCQLRQDFRALIPIEAHAEASLQTLGEMAAPPLLASPSSAPADDDPVFRSDVEALHEWLGVLACRAHRCGAGQQ